MEHVRLFSKKSVDSCAHFENWNTIYCTVECFLRFCFVVKMSADNVILQIFDIFSHEWSLFSTQLSFYAFIKSTELKKDSIHWWKCQKFAKSRYRPTFSQRKQNLRKHSTVHFLVASLIKLELKSAGNLKLATVKL